MRIAKCLSLLTITKWLFVCCLMVFDARITRLAPYASGAWPSLLRVQSCRVSRYSLCFHNLAHEEQIREQGAEVD
jgi:hypothetical protein